MDFTEINRQNNAGDVVDTNEVRRTERERHVASYVEQIIDDVQSSWLPGLTYGSEFTEGELDDMVTEALDGLVKGLTELRAEHVADVRARRGEEE